jgi:hypothetical protein
MCPRGYNRWYNASTQFSPIFILLCWSQVHDHFEAIGTVDCAHLRVVTQGQMCTLTACDANKEIMPTCFAIFPSETATNWETFTRHMFTLFPSFALIVSDGSKGLESVEYIFVEFGVLFLPLPSHYYRPLHSVFYLQC